MGIIKSHSKRLKSQSKKFLRPQNKGYFSNNLTYVKHLYKNNSRKRGLSDFWNPEEAKKDKNSRLKSSSALSSASYNEQVIANWLKSYKIPFTFQATFKGCKDIKPLPFDFRINGKKILIEYDGEQHSKPIIYDSDIKTALDRFELQISHDKIKDNWASKNGFRLIRIYHDDDPIDVLNAHFDLFK